MTLRCVLCGQYYPAAELREGADGYWRCASACTSTQARRAPIAAASPSGRAEAEPPTPDSASAARTHLSTPDFQWKFADGPEPAGARVTATNDSRSNA